MLEMEFEIKTLGRFKYYLEIEVAHSKKGISTSQQKYVIKTRKTTCRLTSTPIDLNIKLGTAKDEIVVHEEMYQRLTIKTRIMY